MTRTVSSLALIIALLLAGRGRAVAEEKKIQKADVPKPVLDAVTKKYPSAKMVAFEFAEEEGKKLYEIGLEQSGTKMDVELSPEGKIEVEETVIKQSDVPGPVKAGLTSSKYKGWKTEKIERVIKEEKTDNPEYEFVVSTKGKKFELVFDKAGKLTKEENKGKEKGND
jgi:hypothetical protein